jgi:glucarate dehydratase
MRCTPVITEMKVIPVAGYDSMLMTLSGAHAPLFTRTIVILEDSSGNTGLGETHGGDDIIKVLEGYKDFVVGQEIGNYRAVIGRIQKSGLIPRDDGEGIQKLDLKNLKFVVRAETAIESAFLDLLGKFLDLPVCALLGGGQQRKEIETLGYLFYVSDKNKTDLPYIDESGSSDAWFRIRRREALAPEAIVEQALAAREKYGFRHFKLKGGVFMGHQEMEAVRALKKAMPDARISIDPNGAWSLEEAIEYCKDMHGILSYVEDPCGPEKGFSGREIMWEFKNATRLRVATNMIVTNWRQLYHGVTLRAFDIVLADSNFWTMNGSVRVGQVLDEWGLTWGCHSNNHFDITLAMYAHAAAAAPGDITAMDTHWIWQDGQDLCKNAMKIENGRIRIPDEPGLGIDIDMDRVMKANELYNKMDSHDRDDSVAMQYLIPGWKFDSKRPCLVR